MTKAEALVRDVEHELGIDATYVYGGGRNFPGAGVIGVIVLELLCAYLATLLGIDDVAKKHREGLKAFIAKLRTRRAEAEAERPAPELMEECNALLDRKGPRNPEEARRYLEAVLLDIGLPARAAGEHAERISKLVEQQ